MPKLKAFPTLLNKSDAMLHAANSLEELAANMSLIKVMYDLRDKMRESADPAAKKLLEDLEAQAAGIIDEKVQEAAMRAAAAEIRAMANETKLAEARAASVGIRSPARI